MFTHMSLWKSASDLLILVGVLIVSYNLTYISAKVALASLRAVTYVCVASTMRGCEYSVGRKVPDFYLFRFVNFFA